MTSPIRPPQDLKRDAVRAREAMSFHEGASRLDCRCSDCNELVARVRDTPGGRLFTGAAPLEGKVHRAVIASWKSSGGAGRPAWPVRAIDVLLDWPDDPTTCQAACPEHGPRRVDRGTILAALQAKRPSIHLPSNDVH